MDLVSNTRGPNTRGPNTRGRNTRGPNPSTPWTVSLYALYSDPTQPKEASPAWGAYHYEGPHHYKGTHHYKGPLPLPPQPPRSQKNGPDVTMKVDHRCLPRGNPVDSSQHSRRVF